jgi:hypothetical protein
MNSMPFDFDPFELDFPALTLKCLDRPPTLFASTQYPTPSSWSILPPGHAQLESLQAYFQEEFRHWKIACAAATTAVAEELTYPPSNVSRTDTKAEVLAAEKAAEKMEKHVYDHLTKTYKIWSGLPPEQREQLWRLELARGVGRKQQEVDRLKEGQHLLRQENANLKLQIDQLTRLQQPREFKIAPPSTLYMDEKMVKRLLEEGIVKTKDFVGFDIADRHSEVGVIVSAVIDRWKKVIVSTRSANRGTQSQLPLDAGMAGEREASPGGSTADVSLASRAQQHPSTTATSQRPSAAPTAATLTPRMPTTPAIHSVAASVSTRADADADEDEDVSMSDADAESDPDPDPDPDGDADGDTDADADADMDDDGDHGNYINDQALPFQHQQQQQQQHQLHPAVPIPPPRQMGRLEVSRTRQQMWLRQGE